MICHYSQTSVHKRLEYHTAQLWENMVSPLCGILSNIFAYHRQSHDPKGIAIGGDLADVASFKGLNGSINYHIGGMGMTREEAMIKCLAESYERYIPVMADPEYYMTCQFDSYENLFANNSTDIILNPELFCYFSEEQHEQKGFFNKFNKNSPLLWVKAAEITRNQAVWIPAQLLFFGYVPKKSLGETRINSAVSTGTAVHTNLVSSTLNSLLEMILIDSAIGHWYTDFPAYKIELSERTRHIQKILKKSIPLDNIHLEFFWLPSIDFPTFNIACIAQSVTIPRFSIGLGSDYTLEGAMYKAFIEFLGTRFLGHTLAVIQERDVESNCIKNLDDNVLYYALGYGNERIYMNFNPRQTIKDYDLPSDLIGSKQTIVQLILKAFLETNKYLGFINLTNDESKELGLVATKLWSPQLITVPTPNAVAINHKRFLEYGGISHLDPHPYP